MQQTLAFILAHIGLILTLLLTGYFGNTLATFLVMAIGKLKGGPFWVVVKFVHGVIDKADPTEPANPAQAKKVADDAVGTLRVLGFILFASFAGLAQTACGGSLHSTIETIMVFEQQVHTEQAQVILAANAAISTLPSDKQQAALATLNAANDKLTVALNAKDAALKAALDASDASGINIQQIEQDILSAINAVVVLVQTFGVAEQTERAQLSAVRLMSARSPVVHR